MWRSLHSTKILVARKHTTTENIYWKLSMGFVWARCIFIYLILWCIMVVAWRCWCPPLLSSNHTAIYTRLRRVPQHTWHGTNIEKRLDFGYPTRATNGLCDVRFFAAKRHGRQRANQVRERLFDLIIIIIITAGIVSFLLYCSNDTDTVQF